MKKIILSAIAVCAFGFANAQDKGGSGLASGNIVLTGDANYTSTTSGDVKLNTMTLSPGLGYMMSDNLMLLGQIGISSGSESTGVAGSTDAKTSGLALNAGVRYFFTPADSFSLSLGGVFGYGSVKSNVDPEDGSILAEDLKVNVTSLTVPVGFHYFMNDHFAVNATWGGLGYASAKADVDGAEAVNSLNLGLNMSSVSFGLLYKL
ncbi:MAG: outer membrane beta-barrel protein [Flavobacterium psychrophilum]